MLLSHSVSALGLVSLVSAQSTSMFSVFIAGADQQPLVASVVGVDSSATTYLVNCPSGTDQNDCGIYNANLTAGGGFVGYEISADEFTGTFSCKTSGTTAASCFESFGGASANFPGTTRTQLVESDITMFPVTITAGLDKLKAGATGSANTPASTTATTTSAGASSSAITVDILFPEVDPKQLAVSVVSAGPSTTIYTVGCATGANANSSCPFSASGTESGFNPWITVAPDFFGSNLTITTFLSQVETVSCQVSSTSSAKCLEKEVHQMSGSAARTTSLSTDLVLSYGAATVTAGAEKLASTSSAAGAVARETAGFVGGVMAVAAVGAGLFV